MWRVYKAHVKKNCKRFRLIADELLFTTFDWWEIYSRLQEMGINKDFCIIKKK